MAWRARSVGRAENLCLVVGLKKKKEAANQEAAPSGRNRPRTGIEYQAMLMPFQVRRPTLSVTYPTTRYVGKHGVAEPPVKSRGLSPLPVARGER